MNTSQNQLILISPAYNESECIGDFVREVKGALDAGGITQRMKVTVIIVDDGSHDDTFKVTKAISESLGGSNFSVLGIRLSRNFGQQAAIQAGLEAAHRIGDPQSFFILMDSDLQHPPQLIPKIMEHLKNGISHVQMVRKDNESLSLGKRTTSRVFYALFRWLTKVQLKAGSSDFRGFNFAFLDAYLKLPEKVRFNRGLFYWIGFDRLDLPYDVEPRFAGKSKYSPKRMMTLSFNAITQFSSKPLILVILSSLALSFICCGIYFVLEIIRYLEGHQFVLGWPSLMFFIAFWSGAILFSQLMLSLYVSRIFDEIKQRPIFLVRESTAPLPEIKGGSHSDR